MALTEERKRMWRRDSKWKYATRVFIAPYATADADRPLIGDAYPGDSTLKCIDVEINYDFAPKGSTAEITAQYSNEYDYEGPENLTEYEYDVGFYQRTDDVDINGDKIPDHSESHELPCIIYRVTKYKSTVNLANTLALIGTLNNAVFNTGEAKSWRLNGLNCWRDQWSLWRITYVFEYHSPVYDAWKAVRWDDTTSPATKITKDILFTGNFNLLGI